MSTPTPYLTGGLNPAVKKAVAIIFSKNETGIEIPQGTGFFLSFPSATDPSKLHRLFVTAKHLLFDKERAPLRSLSIRVNRHKQSAEQIPLGELTLPRCPTIFTHPNRSIDLAVMAVDLDETVYDYRVLTGAELIPPAGLLRAPYEREGLDIMFVALFNAHLGQE